MKKPMYSVEEIHELLKNVEDIDESSPSGGLSTTKESLNSFVLFEGECEGKPFDPCMGIAATAYGYEQKAKELRKIIRTFKCPVVELPKLINDNNPIISTVAHWRLKLGR